MGLNLDSGQGWKKVGRKARHGRKASPVPHKGHRKAENWTRLYGTDRKIKMMLEREALRRAEEIHRREERRNG